MQKFQCDRAGCENESEWSDMPCTPNGWQTLHLTLSGGCGSAQNYRICRECACRLGLMDARGAVFVTQQKRLLDILDEIIEDKVNDLLPPE